MITSNRKHRAKVKSVCALFLARVFCYFHFVSRSPDTRIAHDLDRRFSQDRTQGRHRQIGRAPSQRRQADGPADRSRFRATEDLVGKQIVVVANLETAKLRGLESQGMLLAASDEGRVIVLTPDKPVLAGAKVS